MIKRGEITKNELAIVVIVQNRIKGKKGKKEKIVIRCYKCRADGALKAICSLRAINYSSQLPEQDTCRAIAGKK